MFGLSRHTFLKAVATPAAMLFGLTAPVFAEAPTATPLVSTHWLSENLENDHVIVLDTRSPIAKSGRDDYLKAHIPGALWSEYPGFWRTERAGVVGVLPSIDKLEAALSDLGVSDEKAVVIVPAGTSSLEFGSAARIYWTFKYLGHDNVAILDGGHATWVAQGLPLDAGDVVAEGDLFIAEPNDALLVSTDGVAQEIGRKTLLLDGRPAKQFSGLAKHKKATRFGHLPGAVNFDQANFYDSGSNRLKSTTEIAALLPASLKDDVGPVISYCNTGHWAATNWFVLTELLGREDVTLYDESMVGWSRNAELPMIAPKTAVASN